MKLLIPFLGLSLALPLSAQATYSEKATSSVSVRTENGVNVTTTTNVSFEVATLWTSEEAETYLLKKSLTEVFRPDREGTQASLKVESRKVGAAVQKVLWRLDENAHGGSFDGRELFLTWENGCCSAVTAYRAYNFLTGKLIAAYDGNQGLPEGAVTTPFVIEIPNSPLKRYLGVLSGDAARDFVPGEDKGATKLATLTYASLDGALQIVDVYGVPPEGWAVTTSSELVDQEGGAETQANRMSLWASDGETNPEKAFHGFAIKLSFQTEDSVEVLIPVRNDRLDLPSATRPANYRLVPR